MIVKFVKKLLQSGQNIGFSHVFLEIFPKISRAPRAPKKVKRAPRASRAPKIAYDVDFFDAEGIDVSFFFNRFFSSLLLKEFFSELSSVFLLGLADIFEIVSLSCFVDFVDFVVELTVILEQIVVGSLEPEILEEEGLF